MRESYVGHSFVGCKKCVKCKLHFNVCSLHISVGDPSGGDLGHCQICGPVTPVTLYPNPTGIRGLRFIPSRDRMLSNNLSESL